MSAEDSCIIDAGPALSFLSTNLHRELFTVFPQIFVPEAVRDEIEAKCRHDKRFSEVHRVMKTAGARLVTLVDDVDHEFASALRVVSGIPARERLKISQDRGEVVVIAHGIKMARSGVDAYLLIDDRDAQRRAHRAARTIAKERRRNPTIGTIRILSSVTILKALIDLEEITHIEGLRKTFNKLSTTSWSLEKSDLNELESYFRSTRKSRS